MIVMKLAGDITFFYSLSPHLDVVVVAVAVVVVVVVVVVVAVVAVAVVVVGVGTRVTFTTIEQCIIRVEAGVFRGGSHSCKRVPFYDCLLIVMLVMVTVMVFAVWWNSLLSLISDVSASKPSLVVGDGVGCGVWLLVV